MTTEHAAGNRPAWMMLDQQLALGTAATRLSEQFKGIYGPETIGRFLESSFDQFSDRATVTRFLPLLAERGIDITDEFPEPWTDEVERRVLDLMPDLGLTPVRTGDRA